MENRKSSSLKIIFRIFVGIFLLLNSASCFAQTSRKIYFDASSTTNIDGKYLKMQPGDTLFVISITKSTLRFVNFVGTKEKPIIITNYGGQVVVGNENSNYGILITQCSNVHFTGSGDSNFNYGFKVIKTRSGCNGLSVDGLTSDIEIDHIEICNTGFAGIVTKTNPSCSGVGNRDNFVMEDVLIHDNYIHHTGGEGMYIGHSFYTGYSVICDSVKVSLLPHEIHGLKVYNNILDSCGWDGIQVGCATENCEIFNNTITNYGVKKISAQQTGIQIGGGTTGLCYNNSIIKGSGPGIAVFGIGNSLIYNNIIVDAGYNYFPEEKTIRVYGILCDDRTTTPGNFFHFVNNTIIRPKSDGIRFNPRLSSTNKIYNNLILQPGSLGMHYNESTSYVNLNNTNNADVRSNLYLSQVPDSVDCSSVKSIFDYTFTLDVKAKGLNAYNLGVKTDFNNAERPETANFDIGAFQFNATVH